jgi:hypothetical protein
MNKAQLVELFSVYEKGLAAKARNKSAENAFVSGLYTYYGKTRPGTANNIRATGTKKTLVNFDGNMRAFIKALQDPSANSQTLALANKQARQAAVNYYYANAPKAFYARYPNLATGPFRNILNRATNTKKRFQGLKRNPSITASNAQYQALKALSPNGKTYYGNLPIWRTLTPAAVNGFTNLTPIQKDALKRMIRSVRLNNMEPNKNKVRSGRNREELTNNLMKMTSNRNLLNVIKARAKKSRGRWSTNNTAPAPAPQSKPVGAPTNIFGSRTTSTNWRNFNK